MQFYAAVVFLCIAHCMQYSASVAAAFKGSKQSPSLGWVKHLRVGDVIFAKSFDIEEMSDYVTEMSYQDDGTACFGSAATTVSEDGPLIPFSEKSNRQKRGYEYEDYDTQSYECLREVESVYKYPEYAVGRLDNGCTAFLVGPYHAMTSAKCVYDFNERMWERDLDFWRARNGSGYLQRMEWEQVYIPRELFNQSIQSEDFDWALIILSKSQVSPVWHSVNYCPSKCPGRYITSYGYGNENMILKECEISKQNCFKRIEMQCCQNQAVNFRGGPVFDGYEFDGSKIPPVVGINTCSKEADDELQLDSEPKNEEIRPDIAVKFYSDMFWTVCMLMESSGYEPNCKKL